MATNTIHQELIVALRGTDVPVNTRWSYRADEPFSVTVSFCTERGRWIEWIFARDLLIVGLTEPAGIGDLRVRPGADEDTLTLEICAPTGNAEFDLDREAIEEFLATTLTLVPAGEESAHFDIDRLIGELSGS
jgi:hypothetical protein